MLKGDLASTSLEETDAAKLLEENRVLAREVDRLKREAAESLKAPFGPR